MASCFSTDILFSLHGFFSLDGIATSNAITLKQEALIFQQTSIRTKYTTVNSLYIEEKRKLEIAPKNLNDEKNILLLFVF